MALYEYSTKLDDKTHAKSQLHDLDASYKDMANLCRAVKGKNVKDARKIIDGVVTMTMPVKYSFHKTGMGHRSQLNGQKGRFPKKEAKLLSQLLDNAVANANHKGLDEKKLTIVHASANRQSTQRRYRKFWATGATLGYGKQAVWGNYETCKVEVALAERTPRQKKQRPQKAATAAAGAHKKETKA